MADFLLYLVIFVLLSGCHCLLIRRMRTQEKIDVLRSDKNINLKWNRVLYLILMAFTILGLLAALRWLPFICLGLGSLCLAVLVLSKVYYYGYSGVSFHAEDMAVYGLQKKTIPYSAVHSIVIIRRSYRDVRCYKYDITYQNRQFLVERHWEYDACFFCEDIGECGYQKLPPSYDLMYESYKRLLFTMPLLEHLLSGLYQHCTCPIYMNYEDFAEHHALLLNITGNHTRIMRCGEVVVLDPNPKEDE